MNPALPFLWSALTRSLGQLVSTFPLPLHALSVCLCASVANAATSVFWVQARGGGGGRRLQGGFRSGC